MISLSGEGFSGFPVKNFKEDWDKVAKKLPILKEIEKNLIETKQKQGYSTKKSFIELEKIAFIVRNMYEDKLSINNLPKEFQKYVKFYFE